MISANTAFNTALNSSNRVFDIMVKVTRNTPSGNTTAIDISDRVTSYSTNQDFDSRGGRLNLEIDNYDYAYSPLNRTSSINQVAGVYDPLFDSNHKVELYEGLLVNNSFSYVLKFTGYMGDDITAGSDPVISLSVRDKAKLLQDIYIYQGPSYSLYLVEDCIQDLINTFAPNVGVTLIVDDPTQYMIGRPDGPYAPSDTNLWDAIQTLADSASMELRFLEDGTLHLRQIVRDFSDAVTDLYLDQSNLVSDDMEISDSDVRNYIVVKVQNFDPITKTDQESIDKYGLRYMEVQRSMSDMITDVSQAHELAENILRDLRFANPIENAEIPFNPLVQIGDIVSIENPMLGTTNADDIFKVATIDNEYSKDRKRTRLKLQGYDRFLSIPDIAPKPITGLSSQMQSRTIQNYPNSGWTGNSKTTSFPMLLWTPPTQDASGNTLNSNFGGYIVERATQLDAKQTKIQASYIWGTIASIPSHISSLSQDVNYFYDYSSSSILDKYKTLGVTGNSVTLQYRITAIGRKGSKSTVSSTLNVAIPLPQIT
jgi:hypothetical protein